MIDEPEKTSRLVEELKASLPIETRLSQTLDQTFAKQSPDLVIPASCSVVSIFCAGEEGGIVCGLNIGGPEIKAQHFVSIPHLGFDRHTPLFRQIDSYQRHRIKKLKQQSNRSY